MACDFCDVMNKLGRMADEIEPIELGAKFYDDVISDVYNAIDIAILSLRHLWTPDCTSELNRYWHHVAEAQRKEDDDGPYTVDC